MSYLEAVVPPCAIDDNSQEPCATDIPDLDTVSIQGASSSWPFEEGAPPTMTDMLLGASLLTGKYYPSLAPHIVVRGIANTNSTRCEVYPMLRPEKELINDLYSGLFHYLCFMDFTVNEYLVGKGPATLTVVMHRENLWYVDMGSWDREKQKIERGLEYPQQRTALAFEGRELILFLGTPSTIVVESWEPSGSFSIWYIQKQGDQIRVVSPAKSITTVDEKREWLDHPLEDFTQMVQQAAEERIERTDGRTGIATHHPLLITDANFLQDYYIAMGAVYDNSEGATMLPPPVPGEGDPAAPTIPVNEGTSGVTTPAPGEETFDEIEVTDSESEPSADASALYLKEMLSPCISFQEPGHDPCPMGEPPQLDSHSIFEHSSRWPSPFPTWTDILLGDGNPSLATHLVVRGEGLLGTTRCGAYQLRLGQYVHAWLQDDRLIDVIEDSGLYYYCFMDIGIKEYIVGSGPPQLTVAIHIEPMGFIDFNNWTDSQKENWVKGWLNDPQSRVAIAYEGKELVLLLGMPHTVVVESWRVSGTIADLWFVQNRGNKIWAVAQDIGQATNDEQRNRLEMPLDDLIKDVKQASEERTDLTDGRIGLESYLPLLVTDAHNLRDYYVSVGAVYDDSEDATVLPPPVPKEEIPAALALSGP